MNAEMLTARNGSETVKMAGIFLHSAYNPEQEAERFALNLEADFKPGHVFIIEGALSYCASPLRKKFPDAKICVIRLCNAFKNYDSLWDASFYAAKENSKPLSDLLFDYAGEEGLFASLFYEWPPAVKALPDDAKAAWNGIKNALEKSKSVLATREYFGGRWLKNKINFFSMVKKPFLLKGIQKPVVICASGPSLKAALPAIKAVRKNIFLCALSSACSVLDFYKIEPDLCMTTDGGFWAKKHLYAVEKNLWPLALSTEGNAPARILEKNPVLPLCYEDDELSKKLCGELGIDFLPARRNGTVSGTALEFFIGLGCAEIYFSGLDLFPCKGKSHTEPNALESGAAAKDSRLFPKIQREACAALPSPALKIYEAWFREYNLNGKKVFRIKGENEFFNSLNQIKDIDVKDFLKAFERGEGGGTLSETGLKSQKSKNPLEGMAQTERQNDFFVIKKCLLEFSKSRAFDAEYFPAASILLCRSLKATDREKYQKLLKEKKEKLLEGIFRKLK